MKLIFRVSNRRLNVSSNVNKLFFESIGYLFGYYQKYRMEVY